MRPGAAAAARHADSGQAPADTPVDDRTDAAGAEPTGTESTGSESTGSEPTGSEPTGSEPTGSEPTGSEPTGRGRLRRALRPTLVLLSYVVLACLVYWPVSPVSSHRIIDCACTDPVQEVWFLHWSAWALPHGHNPFFTYYLHAPHGANLALNTSFPLLGAIGAPITWLAGPLVTYNVLLRLALALSAAAMYWVLRRYTSWWPAAYAGGLLFGFSPYMIGHAHRHLFLTFVALVPLFIPVVDDWLVNRRRNPWLAGVLVGLLTAGEYLISPEIALLVVVAVVLGLVTLALRHPGAVRERLRPLLFGCLSAGATMLVFAGYPIYLLLAGRQRPVGALHVLSGLYRFHEDLAAPWLPTAGEWLSFGEPGNKLVKGSIVENGLYLGLPLLILLVVAVVRLRRSALVLASTVVAVVAFVFSMGKTLDYNGHQLLSKMPFGLLEHLPVVQNIEPARLSLFVQLPAALILALALDRFRSAGFGRRAAEPDTAEPDTGSPHTAEPRGIASPARRPVPRWRTVAATVAGVVALAPLIPRVPLRWDTVHVPTFFTSDAVKVIPQGSLALTYPYSRSPVDVPMLWQTSSDMRFRIFGGMAFVPVGPTKRSTWTPPPPSPPDISALLLAGRLGHRSDPTTLAWLPARVRRFLLRYRVQVALVDPKWPNADHVATVLTGVLGRGPQRIADMDVWLDVPGLLRAAPAPGH